MAEWLTHLYCPSHFEIMLNSKTGGYVDITVNNALLCQVVTLGFCRLRGCSLKRVLK